MARPTTFDRGEAVAKAQEVFWRKGFQGTSLKDLESALDLRPSSIYAAFGSKEGLFAEALDLYAKTSGRAFEATLKEAVSPLAGLAAHVRRLGCAPDAHPTRACMLVKTLLETPEDDPTLRGKAEALMRDVESAFAAAFRAAREAGEIPPNSDPERLAHRLQAAIFGMRAYAARSDARDRVTGLAEDIAREIEDLASNPQHRG